MATSWQMGYNSSPLYAEIFICICNKGMMMKRKGGLQPGDQRKLIKFNWMSTFTHSNFKTKSGALRIHGEEDCCVNTECCKAIQKKCNKA